MADDVLKYRVKIFSILLLLLDCCQIHLFQLETGKCLKGSFVPYVLQNIPGYMQAALL